MRAATALALAFLTLAPAAPLAQPRDAGAPARNAPAAAAGPRVYVVMPGDTLLRVAGRLGVPPRDFAAYNSLPRPYTLTVGRRLRVPPGVRPEVLATLPTRDEVTGASAGNGSHRAGFVTMVRARDGGELATNFAANDARLRTRVARFLRARDQREHIVHPRMQRTLQLLSDRFGGRRIVVLSGYRPARAGQPVSRHALGQAVDLRVEGVPLRDVWAFCRSLRDMGCGLYPSHDYVHVDVRTAPEAWEFRPRRRNAPPARALDPDPDEDPALVAAEAAAAPSQD